MDVVEIYKIAHQNFENDIDRRIKMNQFYFTVSASISVAASFVFLNRKSIIELGFHETFFLAFISSILLMVLFVSISWLMYIRAHSKLQLAQLQVIRAIEGDLSHKTIGAVNELFYKEVGKFDRTYAERLIPISFLIFGTALLIQALATKV